MKKNKAFTLIELLAVIVILAIIALIATPIILNMINNARKNSAKSSALGYIDAIEYNNGFAQIQPDKYTLVASGDVSSINIKLKGKKPDSGTVTIDTNGKVTSATLCINGYTVTYDGKDATAGNKCDSSSSNNNNNNEPERTWDNYVTVGQSSGSTLPSGSRIWTQQDTSQGYSETCGVFEHGTVCAQTNAGSFDISSQYVLNKKSEFEQAGATCSVDEYSLICNGYDVGCRIYNYGDTQCYIFNPNNSEETYQECWWDDGDFPDCPSFVGN